MRTKTNERRLKITPGKAVHHEQIGSTEIGGMRRIVFTGNAVSAYIPNEHDADLFCDAHNTANEVDLLPSELLAKLREAATILEGCIGWDSQSDKVINAFLSTLNLPKP